MSDPLNGAARQRWQIAAVIVLTALLVAQLYHNSASGSGIEELKGLFRQRTDAEMTQRAREVEQRRVEQARIEWILSEISQGRPVRLLKPKSILEDERAAELDALEGRRQREIGKIITRDRDVQLKP